MPAPAVMISASASSMQRAAAWIDSFIFSDFI
jgi:hypothetical protein